MKLQDNPKAYAIMERALKVHSILKDGFLESAYGDALEIEFKKAAIPYVREDPVRVYHDALELRAVETAVRDLRLGVIAGKRG